MGRWCTPAESMPEREDCEVHGAEEGFRRIPPAGLHCKGASQSCSQAARELTQSTPGVVGKKRQEVWGSSKARILLEEIYRGAFITICKCGCSHLSTVSVTQDG
ncbi:uncharacterized protein LOC118142964 [Callithrix jacchus]